MRTTHFKKQITSNFLFSALCFYLPRYLSLNKSVRNPITVQANYDKSRAKISIDNVGNYIFGDDSDFYLDHDKIVYGRLEKARKIMLDELDKCLSLEDGETVIEFGSGSGRNLLYLKKKYPNCKFVGLELFSVSVELSKKAAEKFNLDVTFIQHDISKEIDLRADVAFSCHALEQMPGIYEGAVKNMSKSDRVYFFEPASELYPFNIRGLVSRMRISVMNRLKGLLPYLKKNYKIIYAYRLKSSINPLNETVVIRIR